MRRAVRYCESSSLELALTTFLADPRRLKKFARTKDETWIATLVRFFIRQEDSPITQYYED